MEKNLNDGPEDCRQINSRQISTVESRAEEWHRDDFHKGTNITFVPGLKKQTAREARQFSFPLLRKAYSSMFWPTRA